MKYQKRRINTKEKFLNIWKRNTNIPFDEHLFIKKSIEIFLNAVHINKHKLLRKVTFMRILNMCLQSYFKFI